MSLFQGLLGLGDPTADEIMARLREVFETAEHAKYAVDQRLDAAMARDVVTLAQDKWRDYLALLDRHPQAPDLLEPIPRRMFDKKVGELRSMMPEIEEGYERLLEGDPAPQAEPPPGPARGPAPHGPGGPFGHFQFEVAGHSRNLERSLDNVDWRIRSGACGGALGSLESAANTLGVLHNLGERAAQGLTTEQHAGLFQVGDWLGALRRRWTQFRDACVEEAPSDRVARGRDFRIPMARHPFVMDVARLRIQMKQDLTAAYDRLEAGDCPEAMRSLLTARIYAGAAGSMAEGRYMLPREMARSVFDDDRSGEAMRQAEDAFRRVCVRQTSRDEHIDPETAAEYRARLDLEDPT